jgi:hypothetical protein
MSDRIQHQRRIRRDVNRSMEFDDHLLADIGLSREEIFSLTFRTAASASAPAGNSEQQRIQSTR